MARESAQEINFFLILLFMCVLLVEFRRARTREPFFKKVRKVAKKATKTVRKTAKKATKTVRKTVNRLNLIERRRKAEEELRRKAEEARLASIKAMNEQLDKINEENSAKNAAIALANAKKEELESHATELANSRKAALAAFESSFDSSSEYAKVQRGIESSIRKTAEDFQFYVDEYGKFSQKSDDEILNDKLVLNYLDEKYNNSTNNAVSTYNSYNGTVNQVGIVERSEDEYNDSEARNNNNNIRVSNILA
jgi:hypothetical protein